MILGSVAVIMRSTSVALTGFSSNCLSSRVGMSSVTDGAAKREQFFFLVLLPQLWNVLLLHTIMIIHLDQYD